MDSKNMLYRQKNLFSHKEKVKTAWNGRMQKKKKECEITHIYVQILQILASVFTYVCRCASA